MPDVYGDIRSLTGNRFSVKTLERRGKIRMCRKEGGLMLTVSLSLPEISLVDRGVLEGVGADLRPLGLYVRDYYFSYLEDRIEVNFEIATQSPKIQSPKKESKPIEKGPSFLKRLVNRIRST